MQLTGTVTPELHNDRFRSVRQAYFNLNGKLDCKALSSLKGFNYIYARLVAHQIIADFLLENSMEQYLISDFPHLGIAGLISAFSIGVRATST